MPKIRMREIDKTTNQELFSNSNVIFLVDSGYDDTTNKLVLIEDETKIPTKLDTSNTKFIKKVIELGGKVIVAKSYSAAKDYLKDRNQFDVKFLLATQGESSSTDEGTDSDLSQAIDIAKYRRDCAVVYTKILSTDNTLKYETAELNLLKKIDNSDSTDDFQDIENIPGKYVLSFYAKNLKVDNEEIDAGKAYILAYLNSIKKNPKWLAIAGSKRGLIPGDKDKITVGFMSESDIDGMQPDGKTEGKAAINPIVDMNPWGVRIWGNRTAYVSQANDKGLTASSFANIRILLCDLKKQLYKAARKYQFEQNSDVLWVNFQAEVNSLLEEMVHSYGIAGYRWFREETKDRAKIAARLQIIPVEAVEDFDLTIELTDSLTVNE